MSARHIALVFHDRNEIDRLISEAFSRGRVWCELMKLLPAAAADPAARESWRVFCVQRQPQLLHDHTVAENWKLPLWAAAGGDDVEWQWLLKQAHATFAANSACSADCFPAQLDEVAKVAAQFSLAHIVMPDILLLDAVLSGWHQTDQALVWRMIEDYASRYPFRSLVYADVAAPPPGNIPFRLVELVWP